MDRQHNDQKKKDNRTKNDIQSSKPSKTEGNSGVPEGLAVSATPVAPVVLT